MNYSDLEDVFRKVSICFSSPLFYTRLGTDILKRADVRKEDLCKGSLLGLMLEVYVRGVFALHNEEQVIMTAVKLDYPGIGETDIYRKRELLCEVSKYDKAPDNVNLLGYFRDKPYIRVLTTDSITEEPQGGVGYYKIPFAKFCCMLDTGDVFNLGYTTG